MRFGTSTWFFQEYSVTEALTRISACGFSLAEIWMEHLWRSGQSVEEITRHAAKLNMELTLHSTSYDVNITSTNPGICKESLRQVEEGIVLAKRLGVTNMTIHPGHLSSSKGNVEDCWMRLRDTFVLIDEWAQREDVRIGIEAMEKRPKEIYMLPDHIRRLLSEGWSHLGLTLDIAHTFTHINPVDYIQQLDPQWITHVHLSDGSRKTTHLPLGQGEIDIDAALRALSKVYDGTVVLEGIIPLKGQECVCSNKAYLQRSGWM